MWRAVVFVSAVSFACESNSRLVFPPNLSLNGVNTFQGDDTTEGGDPAIGVINLEVVPSVVSVGKLGTQAFTAVAHKLDGTTENVTKSVVWELSDTAVASVASSH